MSFLPRTVVALGFVSLLTDLSSEMIYPLLPAFLAGTLGAGPAVLGMIEGVAEATASLVKILSGLWADRVRRRKPLVLAGYSLSGACRPLIGLAGSWVSVLGLRFGDRIGKGLRTSPRDALIADAVAPTVRGQAFGFHRSMDHAGAVLGPLAASGLLAVGVGLRSVFLLAAVPAAAVVLAILWGVREAASPDPAEPPGTPAAGSPLSLSPGFRRLLAAVTLFTLGNSTDAFLLLRLSGAGVTTSGVALLWSAHHGIKMVSTYAGGRLSDRLGRKPLLVSGWFYYAAVYAGFAVAVSRSGLIALFLAYGVYYGLTEPVERAWAADLSTRGLRGRAYGFYHGAVGLAALPASLLFGALWSSFGAPVAFFTGSALALASSVLLVFVPSRPS
ncbi:MAG: MFS transporter [Deltaproteobacteria bacterium]|nr:MFS transporter [Deltaproteobacteria bacterium]